MGFTFLNSYFRACAKYNDFLLLTQNILKQGYVAPRLKSFYGRHHNLDETAEIER
jgi:16S rRNA G527 N7-methylase RsmG